MKDKREAIVFFTVQVNPTQQLQIVFVQQDPLFGKQLRIFI